MTSPAIQKKSQSTADNAGTRTSWVTEYGIGSGEWFVGSKPQLELLMRPTYQLRVRVYAAGLLHSAGFKDEQAWKQIRTREGTKKVPYASRDLVADLNHATEKYFKEAGVELTEAARRVGTVTKENVRRAIAFLESSGAAERRLKDGTPVRTLPLATRKQLNHNVNLFFFLRPKPATEKQARQLLADLEPAAAPGSSQNGKSVTTYGCLESISFARKVYNKLGRADLWEELAANHKVVNLDYLRAQLEVVCEDYKNAQKVVDADYSKRLEVVHGDPHIRKDRRESKDESISAPTPPMSGVSSLPEKPDTRAAAASIGTPKTTEPPEEWAEPIGPKITERHNRIEEGFASAVEKYPETVYPRDKAYWLQTIRTDDDLKIFFELLPLYIEACHAAKRDRYFSFKNYLMQGVWKTRPKEPQQRAAAAAAGHQINELELAEKVYAQKRRAPR